MKRVVAMIVFTRLCEVNGPEAMRMIAAGELREKFGNQSDESLVMGMNSRVAADPEGAKAWFDGVLGEADTLAVNGKLRNLENAKSVMSLLSEAAREDRGNR